MRLYIFVNKFLSSIQQGIQAAHIVAEFSATPELAGYYKRWSREFKTIIVLNGGNNKRLNEIMEICKNSGHAYVSFKEDDDTLSGMLTSVGVIIPEKLISYIDGEFEGLNMPKAALVNSEVELIDTIIMSRLAQ